MFEDLKAMFHRYLRLECLKLAQGDIYSAKAYIRFVLNVPFEVDPIDPLEEKDPPQGS